MYMWNDREKKTTKKIVGSKLCERNTNEMELKTQMVENGFLGEEEEVLLSEYNGLIMAT